MRGEYDETQQRSDQIKELNREEFANSIAKGLGRALLHINYYGLDQVKDLVLNACLHDLSYDPQSEDSRAEWLFSMFAQSSHYQEFSKAILEALAIEKNRWDLVQLFELALEMALAGDLSAKNQIIDRAYKEASIPSSADWIGADELVIIANRLRDLVLKSSS